MVLMKAGKGGITGKRVRIECFDSYSGERAETSVYMDE